MGNFIDVIPSWLIFNAEVLLILGSLSNEETDVRTTHYTINFTESHKTNFE